MIYPKKINARKSDQIIKWLAVGSVMLGMLLIIINKLTTPNIPWAALSNSGIIYIWITTIYSIKKNANIASHVLLQFIVISSLTLYIDYKLGFLGWSLDIAIPIMIIIANITMFVLTIISYKKFIRYALYELLIVIISMLPLILITERIIENTVLSIIAVSISIITFILTLILSTKDIKEAVIRKFHM